MLIGPDPDRVAGYKAYIGEADSVGTRLRHHDELNLRRQRGRHLELAPHLQRRHEQHGDNEHVRLRELHDREHLVVAQGLQVQLDLCNV